MKWPFTICVEQALVVYPTVCLKGHVNIEKEIWFMHSPIKVPTVIAVQLPEDAMQ